MANKSAKALVFFIIALFAFLVSAVCAIQAYDILADAAMREEYSNPNNVSLDDLNEKNSSSNNNNYNYKGNNLNSTDNGSDSSHNIFDINIFDLFNSSHSSNGNSHGGASSNNDSSDVGSFVSNVFGEVKDRILGIFGMGWFFKGR